MVASKGEGSLMPTNLRELFLLDPSVAFLNHGSFGACPREVLDAYQAWQFELERQPVEFFARRYYDLLREARHVLGAYVGAGPDDLVYVPNATYGLNEVGRSVPLREGDEVLATNHEYPAFENMWPHICRQRGARYVHAPVSLPLTSAEQVVEEVWSGVTGRTRVLFISQITSPTALILPVAELVRRARERGIITIVDGAHAPGQVPLNLREIDPDFYSANCHKWMLSPKGSGFLYARRDVQGMLDPLLFTSETRREVPGSTPFLQQHEYQGTRDVSAYLATPDAVRFMEKHDWDTVRKDCHELLRYARERITALTGLPPLTPDDPSFYMQLASFSLPPVRLEDLKRRLYDEYRVEVPVGGWNDLYFIRVSIQGYNTREDVDRLVEALRVLLPQVAV
jgi:isopenicillin-N epimerase